MLLDIRGKPYLGCTQYQFNIFLLTFLFFLFFFLAWWQRFTKKCDFTKFFLFVFFNKALVILSYFTKFNFHNLLYLMMKSLAVHHINYINTYYKLVVTNFHFVIFDRIITSYTTEELFLRNDKTDIFRLYVSYLL